MLAHESTRQNVATQDGADGVSQVSDAAIARELGLAVEVVTALRRHGRRLLTMKEAAAVMGVTYERLRHLRSSQGWPKGIKTGKLVMYRPEDLEREIAEHRES
jgi:predicted transcriptional regulator of viral defense system